MDYYESTEALNDTLTKLNILVTLYGMDEAREIVNDYNENGADIFGRVRADLFQAMRADFETMAYYGDNEGELMAELEAADAETLEAYADTFLL